MLAVGLLATARVWRDLWETAARHGEIEATLLAPLLAAWLLWVRRERLRLCEPVKTWVGPIVVGVSWVMGLAGDQLGAQVLVHLSGLGIVFGCLLSVLGADVLRLFLPVFGALLLLTPVPWGIHQWVAYRVMIPVADLGLLLYEAIGIDVGRRGDWLDAGGHAVPIIKATGVPGLKATFLIAYGLAYGQPLKTWVRLLMLGVAPAAAVAYQILGTLVTIWLVSLAVDAQAINAAAGWLLIPMMFVMLLGLVKLLGWASVPVQYYTLAQDR